MILRVTSFSWTRYAALTIATSYQPRGWLNDAVKGLLDERGDFDPFLELPSLRVFIARPEYLLAMKCASMRLAEEFRDQSQHE